MGWFLGINVKRMAPCRCVDGHVKEPLHKNVYGVESPTVGPTSSSVSLHIYVSSYIYSKTRLLAYREFLGTPVKTLL